MTDPIADMLTRIRNAVAVSHETVLVPHSNMKEAIAKSLQHEDYISGYTIEKTDYGQPNIIIKLKYIGKQPTITKIERVSKPGLRTYSKKKHLKSVLSGHGVTILSTSHGVMTNKQAMKQNLGGEVLCRVW